MLSRVTFIAITTFWLVMNYLLWRSQIGGKNQIGNTVPVAAVWQKIITAPDNSTLDIYQHEKKIGLSDWAANIGQSAWATGKAQSDGYQPDGMVEKLTSYTLNFKGSAYVSPQAQVRFEASLKLSASEDWQGFHLRANLPPNSWEVHAVAKNQNVHLKIEDENGPWEKNIKFSELENPEALLQDFGGSYAVGLLGLASGPDHQLDVAHAMRWEAHEDRMQFGHSKVRVYRLEARLLGQTIYIFVSRVGEILWVELPNHITLRNDAFSHF